MLFATLITLSVGGTLNLEGQSSSILFNNNARLTVTTMTEQQAAAPLISRMAPLKFAPVQADAQVNLRLRNVALSCADTGGRIPCALPFDEMDLPGWYCTWNNSQHSTVVGPLHASVSGLTSNTSEAEIHAGCTAACSTKVLPTLACPLPGSIGPFMGSSGSGTLYLFVSYFAPMSSDDAVYLPFDGIYNSVQVEPASPPPPASPPAPPSPPPPTSPPPNAPRSGRSWYHIEQQSYRTSSTSYNIRFIPIYFSPEEMYTYPSFKARCVAATSPRGSREWNRRRAHHARTPYATCMRRVNRVWPPYGQLRAWHAADPLIIRMASVAICAGALPQGCGCGTTRMGVMPTA